VTATSKGPLQDFVAEANNLLSAIRTKDQATVRIIPDESQRQFRLEMCFTGRARSIGTLHWCVGYEAIVDPNLFDAPRMAAESITEIIEDDLRKRLLIYDPPIRVVKRKLVGVHETNGIVWTVQSEEKVWDGFSADDYLRKGRTGSVKDGRIGRIDGSDQGTSLWKLVLVMQEIKDDGWHDLKVQPTPVSPATVTSPSDPKLSVVSTGGSQDAVDAVSAALDSAMTATERKRARQSQATTNRSQARIDPEEERRRQERREEAQRVAEENRRQAEIIRMREERLKEIRDSASSCWEDASETLKACSEAWAQAALHEAEARDEQVEAELFGGGAVTDPGEKWVEAERAAKALLEFAQARIDEARARRAGKGFEIIYGEEEDSDELVEAAECFQEHTHEEEIVDAKQQVEELRRERLTADLRQEADREKAAVDALPEDPPDTASDVIDALVSSLATAPAPEPQWRNPLIPERQLPLPGVPDPNDRQS